MTYPCLKIKHLSGGRLVEIFGNENHTLTIWIALEPKILKLNIRIDMQFFVNNNKERGFIVV